MNAAFATCEPPADWLGRKNKCLLCSTLNNREGGIDSPSDGDALPCRSPLGDISVRSARKPIRERTFTRRVGINAVRVRQYAN